MEKLMEKLKEKLMEKLKEKCTVVADLYTVCALDNRLKSLSKHSGS